MSWRSEKTKEGSDFVYDGVEKGIGVSPTQGTANIQNANISTESGEVMASYRRTAQQQVAIAAGTLTPSGTTLLNAPATLQAGTWVKLSASTISSLTAYSAPTTAAISYLTIGGGGAGGSTNGHSGGGGGAGAMVSGTSTVAVGTYAITVGAGGVGAFNSGAAGADGSSSVIATIATAAGGSGGGGGNSSFNGRSTGGSGGGGGTDGSTAGTGGAGSTGGNTGGTARSTSVESAGGGGGAGGVGQAGQVSTGGSGGTGNTSSISGTAVTYAGGGGGGRISSGGTATSGGGAGGSSSNGSDGTANTGGGGGGAGGASVYIGGSGGSGIVIISYTTGTMLATGGNISFAGGKTIHTFLETDTFTVLSLAPTNGYYYVSYKDTNNRIKLSAFYDLTAAHAIVHGSTGTATFDTAAVPGAALAKATEKYTTATGTEYRYYMLDSSGYVWVYDTAIYDSSLIASGVATTWMLPDYTDYSNLQFSGMAILNGWLMVVSHAYLYGKPTVDLGRYFYALSNSKLNNPFPTHSNFAYVGHQGKMYYCDGNYIGELFPTTSFETNIANIQSFNSYTASGTIGTISAVIGGSLPYDPGGTRIPVCFFTDQYGTVPTVINESTVYYLQVNPAAETFTAYANLTGGSPLDIATGATGNQYYNTFYPLGNHASINGDHSLVTFSAQRVNLPYFEIATCLIEIGNTVLIGGITNTLYPWNQVDATPSDFIALPENGVVAMINVNNMAYVFAGNKGNVYISNGSVASLVLKVPDYCAGVPGSPLTYIEPYFTWGDAAYIRGRVYFSILDQTATKAGNCGGVWSFVPTQNLYIGQDTGLALRLENQNSYGDYDGMARLIIPNEEQVAVSPQYWSFWQDSYSIGTSAFGIDQTATTPVATFVIETDLLATGTFLSKDTFQQLEYKLTTKLQAGDSVALFYRLNASDAWLDSETIVEETANRISGYAKVVFQKTQWVQFRVVCTTSGTTSSSFVRFKQLMLR